MSNIPRRYTVREWPKGFYVVHDWKTGAEFDLGRADAHAAHGDLCFDEDGAPVDPEDPRFIPLLEQSVNDMPPDVFESVFGRPPSD
jgi:hypothetical protein